MGGVFMLGVSNDVRASSGRRAGDEVDVDLELDTEPREVEVPPDLAAALDADDAPGAPSRPVVQQQAARSSSRSMDAKTPETRQRRIDKAVESARPG